MMPLTVIVKVIEFPFELLMQTGITVASDGVLTVNTPFTKL